MASTKSALNNTFCERSQHLCAAPTFVLGSQALWVIVDLTEFRIAGLRWTNVGDNSIPAPITERKLENEYVFEKFCEQVTELSKGEWSLKYQLTSSDGLRVSEVQFKQQAILQSAKVVDWHVSYSKFDGFGYSDATGCPMFSSAVVVAADGPKLEEIFDGDNAIGFSLTQDFKQVAWPAPCNYRYQERYEFYNDGRFRTKVTNLGRGCGSNGAYRPVLRLSLPHTQHAAYYAIQEWKNNAWISPKVESWSAEPLKNDLSEGLYSHKLISASGAQLMVQPSTGEPTYTDNAYFYTTVEHTDKAEGADDLVTLGSCCNSDYRQGPEQFMSPPESLENQDLVLWYVPQLENENSQESKRCWAETRVVDGLPKIEVWPCSAGLTLHANGVGYEQ